MEEEVIQFIGVKDLSEEEQAIVNTLSTEYYGKIKTYMHNLTSVAVHIKTQKDEAGKDKEKKRKKFSIKVRVMAPTHVFESKHASDWDLARTLHKAFKNIEHEIEHKLKVSDQNLHQ
jgi:hypothetical protein